MKSLAFFLLTPAVSLALPSGGYRITTLSIENTPGRKPDGKKWDPFDSIPELFVEIETDNEDAWTSGSAGETRSHTWAMNEDIYLEYTLTIIAWDEDISNHDEVDRVNIDIDDLEIGSNTFSMYSGSRVTIDIARRLEELHESHTYWGNYGGTGQDWRCIASVEGNYSGASNTRIGIELYRGMRKVGWWNGRVSDLYLMQSEEQVQFGLEEPVFNIVVSDTLLSFYEQPGNFDGFQGFAIGIRPCMVVLAYDPVLEGLVEVLTPEKIQARHRQMNEQAFEGLMSGLIHLISEDIPEWAPLLSLAAAML